MFQEGRDATICGTQPLCYRRFSFERSMAESTPNRSRNHLPTCSTSVTRTQSWLKTRPYFRDLRKTSNNAQYLRSQSRILRLYRFSRGHPLPSGPKIRWRIGNTSTKVLFGHPPNPSRFVLYEAAPASLLLTTGGELSLKECAFGILC